MQREQKHKYMKGMHGFLRVFLSAYTRIFSIRSKISKDVKDLKAPYLLLSNHIGTWDPFVVGYFLDKPIHFVSSDAVFRDRFMRFLLTRMGVIPKKKNVKDTKVIRTMLSVIENDNCIGLFPEASRSWTGRTMHIDAATAKLVKLLKVPVVCAKMKGMQLFNPRWGTRLRMTRVIIDYKVSLTKEEVLEMNESEIREIIRNSLYHNEVEYQRIQQNKIYSFEKAEYISYVLFTCPKCKSIGEISTKGDDFYCTSCESKWRVNKLGFFEGKGHESQFDNINDWYDWQLSYFNHFIEDKVNANYNDVIFSDKNMVLFKEKKNGFRRVGLCDMYFYVDRIEIIFQRGKKMILPIKDIQTLSPQLRERIEILFDDKAFRVKGRRKGVSGLKWEMACNVVWKKEGQEYKLSTYFQ